MQDRQASNVTKGRSRLIRATRHQLRATTDELLGHFVVSQASDAIAERRARIWRGLAMALTVLWMVGVAVMVVPCQAAPLTVTALSIPFLLPILGAFLVRRYYMRRDLPDEKLAVVTQFLRQLRDDGSLASDLGVMVDLRPPPAGRRTVSQNHIWITRILASPLS